MDASEIRSILKIGETIGVEFKHCGNGIGNDVYETVCSFLNRFGGKLFWAFSMMGQSLVFRIRMFMTMLKIL